MKKNNKKMVVVSIFLLLLILIGGTYAWLSITKTGTKTNVITAGSLDLVLNEDETNGINITSAVPMSDKKGKEQEGYTFKLINNGTMKTGYTIYLDDLPLEADEERMKDKDVKYSLVKNGEELSTGLITNTGINPNRKIDLGEIEGGVTNTYTLKVWMNEDA